ncbi:MAG: hypothetical protein KF708_19835 [Pirellulales bacterium]|nr:hypothetical protein [Pirellulales bacterium]
MHSSPTTSSALGGGHDARAMALAVGLGLLAGFVTGPSLTLLCILLAVVLFNAHTRTFIFAWGTAWMLSWPLRPFTGGLGKLLLDDTWCADVLRHWDESLLPVLLDWHRYTTFGGLLLGSFLGGIAAWRVYCALSMPCGAPQEAPEGPPTRPSFEVRLCTQLRRFLVQSPDELACEARWLRPWGVPVAALCLCLITLVATWLVPLSMRRAFVERLSVLNGAEVTTGELSLDLSTGRLVIDDLRLADPAALDHDRWRVGRVEGSLSIGLLARGRLEFETLKLSTIRENVPRAELAQLRGNRTVHTVIRGLEEPVLLTPSAVEVSNDARTSELPLSSLTRDWNSLAERLQLVRRVVCGVESLHELEMTGKSSATQFAPIRGRACFHARELTVEGLARRWGFGPKSLLTIKHLSSDPGHGARATELTLVAPELAAEMRATLQLLDDSPRHDLALEIYDLPLVRVCHPDGVGRYLAVSSGVADLRGTGTCDRDGFELFVRAEARGLEARFTTDEPLAGVSPVAWNEALRRLNPLRGKFVLGGKWSSPRIALDNDEVVADLKGQLRAVNEQALVEIFERHRSQHVAQSKAVDTATASNSPAVPEGASSTTEEVAQQASPAGAAPEQPEDRYARYRRYQAQTESTTITAAATPSVASTAAASAPAATPTAPVATVESNPLFQQMVPTATPAPAEADGVCKSCMTESDGGNYLPPGTEIHAPQVSIDGPTQVAADTVTEPNPESNATTEPAAPIASTETMAAGEPPLPETTVGMATPASVFPTQQSQAASIYRPYYGYGAAANPSAGPSATVTSQTVPASATAAATASQQVAPASTATFNGVSTGYADGTAQALPLEGAHDSADYADDMEEPASADGMTGRARAAGSRVAAWTGGMVSRMRGWWPRRTTDEERAALAGDHVALDPWASENAAVESETESAPATPTEPEVPTNTATTPPAPTDHSAMATTVAAEPMAPTTAPTCETHPPTTTGLELEAQRPSVWQRMQFWRSWR